MESNIELKKSNAVLLYILLNFPDGLKEGELYGIIRDAQKIHLEQYGSYIIGEPKPCIADQLLKEKLEAKGTILVRDL